MYISKTMLNCGKQKRFHFSEISVCLFLAKPCLDMVNRKDFIFSLIGISQVPGTFYERITLQLRLYVHT